MFQGCPCQAHFWAETRALDSITTSVRSEHSVHGEWWKLPSKVHGNGGGGMGICVTLKHVFLILPLIGGLTSKPTLEPTSTKHLVYHLVTFVTYLYLANSKDNVFRLLSWCIFHILGLPKFEVKDTRIDMAIYTSFIGWIVVARSADWNPVQFLSFAFVYRIFEKLKEFGPRVSAIFIEEGEDEGRLMRMGKCQLLFHASLEGLSKDDLGLWNELCRERIKDAHKK
ncbi:chloroplast J-like domain protein 1, partial [Tanacetum coccineum]